MIEAAVVPAAGLATRMMPASKAVPKPLLPLGGKPVAQHIVEELVAAGVRRIAVVIGPGGEAVRRHFEPDPDLERRLREAGRDELAEALPDPKTWERLRFVTQPDARGLGDAVLHGLDAILGRPAAAAVALGDAVLVGERATGVVPALGRALEARSATAALAVTRVEGAEVGSRGLVLAAGGAGSGDTLEVSSVVEKPDPSGVAAGWVIAGRYAIGAAVAQWLRERPPEPSGELGLTEAIAELVEAGERVVAIPLPDGVSRIDAGNHTDYERGLRLLSGLG